MMKFYAKVHVGNFKGSVIGMLAEYTVAIGCCLSCKQLSACANVQNYLVTNPVHGVFIYGFSETVYQERSPEAPLKPNLLA